MIKRLVKMTFQEDKVDEFWAFLEPILTLIRNFPGCQSLEILRDNKNTNIIMTLSEWDSEDDLNNYRDSDLFKMVWGQAKIKFEDIPIANSLVSLRKL